MDEYLIEEQTRCLEIASPLLPPMYEAWHEAVACYQKEYSDRAKAEHNNTTVANCIHSHMWAEVHRRFDEHPGCVLRNLRTLKLLLLHDQLVFRFKKVDGFGRHRNYPTQQQNDFDDQMELPGIPPSAVRLTCGYQPDITGQAIERIVIARVWSSSVLWAAQINLVDQETASWADITPKRFTGTDRIDYRGRRMEG